jgi:hypothetical protein
LHWREFLKIKDQFLGGIKDPHNQHPGSAGILIFFRWFLDVFILVRMRFAFGLQSNQFALKVIPFQKVLKNAQNGSGSSIREVLRG